MKKTQKITKWEVIVRILTFILVVTLSYVSGDTEKQLFNVIGFLIAFIISIYLHKHFFPFLMISIMCYLSASVQELWSASYTYVPITRLLWTMGNIFLPVGLISFAYRLMFKYKIVDKDEN